MPEQTLADLMREVGIQRADRPRLAPRVPRAAAWGVMSEPQRVPRGMPRLQAAQDEQFAREAEQRQFDELRSSFREDQTALGYGPRNQVAEIGPMLLEGTGLPAIQRSGEAFRAGDPGRGTVEFAQGALGLVGTIGGMQGVGMRPPRAPTPPARSPSRAYRGMRAPYEPGAPQGTQSRTLDAGGAAGGGRLPATLHQRAPLSWVIDADGQIVELTPGAHADWIKRSGLRGRAIGDLGAVMVSGDASELSVMAPETLTPAQRATIAGIMGERSDAVLSTYASGTSSTRTHYSGSQAQEFLAASPATGGAGNRPPPDIPKLNRTHKPPQGGFFMPGAN